MVAMVLELKNLKVNFDTWVNLKDYVPVYRSKEDTLFVEPSKPREATSLDINGELWLRVDVRTGEIVGLEIEDFESVFLEKHPEVKQAWRESKPRYHRRGVDRTLESFLLILLDFLKRMLQGSPRQVELGLVSA